MKEFKSKCENCGEMEFDENERVWGEDEYCYCACGQELKFIRAYKGKINTVGLNDN